MTNRTDREMLGLCLAAFEAVPTADASRKFLKEYKFDLSGIHWGTRSHLLAKVMQRVLRKHLGVKS